MAQREQWQPTRSSSLAVYDGINEGLLKISGSEITIATLHEDCIIQDENQLSAMVLKVGNVVDKANAQKLIELFVIEVFEWFGKEISIQQIQSLGKIIYQNYWWLKIAELKLFVEKLKAGHWKQVHGMSPAVLMERLGEFAKDSMNIREQIGPGRQNLDPNFIAQYGEVVSEKLLPIYNRLNEKIEETKKPAKVKENSNNWHRENEFCTKWLKENEVEPDVALQWYGMFLLRKPF